MSLHVPEDIGSLVAGDSFGDITAGSDGDGSWMTKIDVTNFAQLTHIKVLLSVYCSIVVLYHLCTANWVVGCDGEKMSPTNGVVLVSVRYILCRLVVVVCSFLVSW